MGYFKSIWESKKIKKIREKSSSFFDENLKKIKKSDKFKKIEEKVKKLNKKYKIDDKAKKVAQKVEETGKDLGQKIESVLNEKISFDDFSKVEIKLGKILEAEKIEKNNKLLKLKVDFGNGDIRQVASGIAKDYRPEDLVEKKTVFVTNLEGRKIMGLDSEAMILGVSDEKDFSILISDKDIVEGAKAL